MTMVGEDRLQRLVEERRRLAASRGFTIDYQNEQESQENVICRRYQLFVTYDIFLRFLLVLIIYGL